MPTLETKMEDVEQDRWTRPAFLRRVRIRNFKSIDFCDVPLQPFTILVGRNAAGKSNFLDALAFLSEVVDVGVAEAIKRRGGWNAVVSRNAPQASITIEIEAGFACGHAIARSFSDESKNLPPSSTAQYPKLTGNSFLAHYSLEVLGGINFLPVITHESLVLAHETADPDGKLGGFDLGRPAPQPNTSKSSTWNGAISSYGNVNALRWNGDKFASVVAEESLRMIADRRSDLCLLSLLGFQPFLDLSDGLRFMAFHNFHPEAIRTVQKPTPGWLLARDGRNLASVIEGLKETDPASVERVRDYLKLIAEEVDGFDVQHYGDFETVKFTVRQGANGNTQEFDASSMSDGTIRALAALIAVFQIHHPSGPSVVGIEEPETALHPAAMRALVDALDDATQQTQIIVTTHSADLLSGRDINSGQVLVVRNRDGKTQLTPLDPASHEIIENELYSLADLQRMDRLDLDEADLRRQDQLTQQGV